MSFRVEWGGVSTLYERHASLTAGWELSPGRSLAPNCQQSRSPFCKVRSRVWLTVRGPVEIVALVTAFMGPVYSLLMSGGVAHAYTCSVWSSESCFYLEDEDFIM